MLPHRLFPLRPRLREVFRWLACDDTLAAGRAGTVKRCAASVKGRSTCRWLSGPAGWQFPLRRESPLSGSPRDQAIPPSGLHRSSSAFGKPMSSLFDIPL